MQTITPTELQRVGLDAVLANVLSFVTGPAAKVTAITRKPGKAPGVYCQSIWRYLSKILLINMQIQCPTSFWF
jgi:hypothetical protein